VVYIINKHFSKYRNITRLVRLCMKHNTTLLFAQIMCRRKAPHANKEAIFWWHCLNHRCSYEIMCTLAIVIINLIFMITSLLFVNCVEVQFVQHMRYMEFGNVLTDLCNTTFSRFHLDALLYLNKTAPFISIFCSADYHAYIQGGLYNIIYLMHMMIDLGSIVYVLFDSLFFLNQTS